MTYTTFNNFYFFLYGKLNESLQKPVSSRKFTIPSGSVRSSYDIVIYRAAPFITVDPLSSVSRSFFYLFLSDMW